MNNDIHRTVLLDEAVDALAIATDSVVVDATGGMGGHSIKILEKLGKKGTLFIIDRDPVSLSAIKERIGTTNAAVHYICDDFRHIADIVRAKGITEVDAVLADLGWNSDQFQKGGRGFSFQTNEPLFMTYGDPDTYAFTAQDIVNDWKEETIADMLYAYADERYSRRIAHAICEARKNKPLETTDDLVAIVRGALPKKLQHARLHPATKTFQALRIAVNDELDAVVSLIDSSCEVVKKRGRIAIITFHSTEDRIVKNCFRQLHADGKGALVTKKPLVPTDMEVQKNPRSRSAKLRVIEKT